MAWRSKQFFSHPTCYSCAKVEADRNVDRGTLLAKIYGDGRLLATITDPNQVVRLPSGRKYSRWEVEVAGNMQVTAVYIAHSPEEIAAAIQ